MFTYYGSKTNLAHLYPRPKHELIIEPFAGSARYSLRYFERDVVLVDKYKVVIDIWRYLQSASEKDILGLPRLKENETLDQFNLSPEERLFLGFNIKAGSATPANKANYRNTVPRPNKQNFKLEFVAKNLWKIRHWKLVHGEYNCIANVEATWFIDPPYLVGGEHYKWSSRKINFDEISRFSKTRKGQVIVCENTSADWLPFIHLKQQRGSIKSSSEAFWTNEQVEYQAELFQEI